MVYCLGQLSDNVSEWLWFHGYLILTNSHDQPVGCANIAQWIIAKDSWSYAINTAIPEVRVHF